MYQQLNIGLKKFFSMGKNLFIFLDQVNAEKKPQYKHNFLQILQNKLNTYLPVYTLKFLAQETKD